MANLAPLSYPGGMQVPLSDWPAGLDREIATIDPVAIAEGLGARLRFERDHDDLDRFTAAILIIDGTYFALQLYDNIPTGHVTLIAMNDVTDDRASLDAFLRWSGIPPGAVTWRRPTDGG